jgi:hypothetical protein
LDDEQRSPATSPHCCLPMWVRRCSSRRRASRGGLPRPQGRPEVSRSATTVPDIVQRGSDPSCRSSATQMYGSHTTGLDAGGGRCYRAGLSPPWWPWDWSQAARASRTPGAPQASVSGSTNRARESEYVERHAGDPTATLRILVSVKGEDARRLERIAEAGGKTPHDVVAELRNTDSRPRRPLGATRAFGRDGTR